ncbi:hypothetical protein ASE77_07045 [Sphingomonas sp. Leaf226]|nr:hypothetical protein ASE77_07045 [Sphingomonas sp. Leaf226]
MLGEMHHRFTGYVTIMQTGLSSTATGRLISIQGYVPGRAMRREQDWALRGASRPQPRPTPVTAIRPARATPVPALRTVLYLSKIKPDIAMDQRALMDIVNDSRARNAQAGITGALIITDLHFVQLVEGPDPAISNLLARLSADRRHSDVTIITDMIGLDRGFRRFSLAYSGPDTFVDQQLIPMLATPNGPGKPEIACRLINRLRLMADNEITETDYAA